MKELFQKNKTNTLDFWLKEAVSLSFACWEWATLPYKPLNWGLKTRQHYYLLYSKHLTWMLLGGENGVLSGAHFLQQQLVIWGGVSFTAHWLEGVHLIYSTDWGVVFETELLELVHKEQENFIVKCERILFFTYFLFSAGRLCNEAPFSSAFCCALVQGKDYTWGLITSWISNEFQH